MTIPGALRDRDVVPSAAQFSASTGPAIGRWNRLVQWLATTYGSVGEPLFSGAETGWTLRFRRSGKALLTLLPMAGGGFRALVVVGPSAWHAIGEVELSVPILEAWEAAHPYPDGRWLWPIVDSDAVVDDIERLVALKSPPPRRPRALVTAGAR